MKNSFDVKKSIKLDMSEWDSMEIPTEDSSNCITRFSTNTNKLLSDKGFVKQKDRISFKSEKIRFVRFSGDLPYVRAHTRKVLLEEAKAPINRFSSMWDIKVNHKRNSTVVGSCHKSLSKIDSPRILRSMQQISLSKEGESQEKWNRLSVLNPKWRYRI